MDLGIRGRVAIVTGSSSGIGCAIAMRLAEEGCRLALFARSLDTLQAAAREMQSRFGVGVIAIAGDMTVEHDVDRLLAEVTRVFGGADILVLNSGRAPRHMAPVLDEHDNARWEAAYRGQLWGPGLVVRKIVPAIVARKWGRVIGVTSASVKQPMPKHALSTIYRAGVTAMLKHLANEVARSGVTVNIVAPASIGTDALRASFAAEDRAAKLPVGRLGRPEEVAAAVAFLASEHAAFITGTTLQVDGGMVASLQ